MTNSSATFSGLYQAKFVFELVPPSPSMNEIIRCIISNSINDIQLIL